MKYREEIVQLHTIKPKLKLDNEPDKVYIGITGDFLHFVFSDEDRAKACREELKSEKNITGLKDNNTGETKEINIHLSPKRMPEYRGLYLMRIHKSDWEKLGLESDDVDLRPSLRREVDTLSSNNSDTCTII